VFVRRQHACLTAQSFCTIEHGLEVAVVLGKGPVKEQQCCCMTHQAPPPMLLHFRQQDIKEQSASHHRHTAENMLHSEAVSPSAGRTKSVFRVSVTFNQEAAEGPLQVLLLLLLLLSVSATLRAIRQLLARAASRHSRARRPAGPARAAAQMSVPKGFVSAVGGCRPCSEFKRSIC